MHHQTLIILTILNDLRHAGLDALKEKHKLPSLLLFYAFIDICASLASEDSTLKLGERFQRYLQRYALTKWSMFTPRDLWSARSSLVHTFSPLGRHTQGENPTKPIFYYAWPERPEEVHAALSQRGYKDFLLLDVRTIKGIAISAFNGFWMRVDSEPEFEATVRSNGQHLLKDHFHMKLEDELSLLAELKALSNEASGA